MTKEHQELILRCRRFAIDCHKKVNQIYDGLPYHIHLVEVEKYAQKFKHLLTEYELVIVICLAWCHDSIEDGNITYNDLKKVVGEQIADAAYLLSNNRGKTREERADDDYYLGITNDHIALYGKLCDRLANMSHSFLYGDKGMFEKYTKELPHFKEKLYNGLYDEMWDFLENIELNVVVEEDRYPDIVKFDEETIYGVHLPNPIPFTVFNELYNKGILRKCELGKNRYYLGHCRNASVALWNGFEFVYMRTKFGSTYPETIKHIEDDNEMDLFIPLRETQPTENQRVKY